MNFAVIFAGGIGSRMHTSTPKQFLDVLGKPVIIHTLEQFQKHPLIHAISLVCLKDRLQEMHALTEKYSLDKVKFIVPGASTGQQSIFNGLSALQEIASPDDIVLINDGVRPFVSQDIITKCIECTEKFGSAIVSAPVPDTIGLIAEDSPEIFEIPDRKQCHALKAPQGFRLGDIIGAHHKAMKENCYRFTNSAELFRNYGGKIYAIIDEGVNFKITSPIDLELMKAIMPKWLKGEKILE